MFVIINHHLVGYKVLGTETPGVYDFRSASNGTLGSCDTQHISNGVSAFKIDTLSSQPVNVYPGPIYAK